MQLRMGRGRKKSALATVHFTSAKNDKGVSQLCVFVECQSSGRIVGPSWSHTDQSVRRALAMLTECCDCPAVFHKAREHEGHRVLPTNQARL